MSEFRDKIAPHVEVEFVESRNAYNRGEFAESFKFLERAHVMGQESTVLHTKVHWEMLAWGVRRRNAKEIVGQLYRLIGAITKTEIGLVPYGNTGGANVSPFRKMPVPPDLQRRIDAAKSRH